MTPSPTTSPTLSPTFPLPNGNTTGILDYPFYNTIVSGLWVTLGVLIISYSSLSQTLYNALYPSYLRPPGHPIEPWKDKDGRTNRHTSAFPVIHLLLMLAFFASTWGVYSKLVHGLTPPNDIPMVILSCFTFVQLLVYFVGAIATSCTLDGAPNQSTQYAKLNEPATAKFTYRIPYTQNSIREAIYCVDTIFFGAKPLVLVFTAFGYNQSFGSDTTAWPITLVQLQVMAAASILFWIAWVHHRLFAGKDFFIHSRESDAFRLGGPLPKGYAGTGYASNILSDESPLKGLIPYDDIGTKFIVANVLLMSASFMTLFNDQRQFLAATAVVELLPLLFCGFAKTSTRYVAFEAACLFWFIIQQYATQSIDPENNTQWLLMTLAADPVNGMAIAQPTTVNVMCALTLTFVVIFLFLNPHSGVFPSFFGKDISIQEGDILENAQEREEKEKAKAARLAAAAATVNVPGVGSFTTGTALRPRLNAYGTGSKSVYSASSSFGVGSGY